MLYSFTCPLQGCALVMKSNQIDEQDAANDLVAQAKQHLKDVHPDIHKTDEEVSIDIHSHMTKTE